MVFGIWGSVGCVLWGFNVIEFGFMVDVWVWGWGWLVLCYVLVVGFKMLG